VSLFDGIPLDYEDLQPVAPVKVAEPAYMLTIKSASTGQKIMLCNVTPPPSKAIAEAKAQGLALFVFDEVEAIRKAAADGGSHAVDIIIAVRLQMGYGGPEAGKPSQGPIEYRGVA
jgi:hypothetical protein